MKTIFIHLVVFFCLAITYGQVGINNVSPNALLDIQASNTTTPSNTDGILIPKIDDFPTIIPTGNQDGMMIFATGSGVPTKGFYFWDNVTTSWKSISGGLEALDEGNGQGWRLSGRDPNNYGNIGLNAIDLSYSDGISNFYGATGIQSFAVGYLARTSGNSATAIGPYAHGEGYSGVAIGSSANAVGDFSVAIGRNSHSLGNQSLAIGRSPIAIGDFATAIGFNTRTGSYGETAIGMWNTYIIGDLTNFVPTDRLFVIGNGPDFLSNSDALTILKNGTITAPSYDVSEITDNKALITKEYADANYSGSGGTGLETLDEGNGIGWRLVGRDPTHHGVIGEDAIDLSVSNVMNNTHGATGIRSFAWGLNSEASGLGAIALAVDSNASGDVSIAFGGSSTASGRRSTAIGFNVLAEANQSTAMGRNNIGGGNPNANIPTDPLFEIGNGATPVNRSNALTILKNGTITAPSFDISEITDNKALITKEYADITYVGGAVEAINPTTLNATWAAYGVGYKDPGYYIHNERIHLEGLLRKTGVYASGETIFTLPIGYRPASRVLAHGGQDGNAIRIDILANGNVLYMAGATALDFISLEGISFRVN